MPARRRGGQARRPRKWASRLMTGSCRTQVFALHTTCQREPPSLRPSNSVRGERPEICRTRRANAALDRYPHSHDMAFTASDRIEAIFTARSKTRACRSLKVQRYFCLTARVAVCLSSESAAAIWLSVVLGRAMSIRRTSLALSVVRRRTATTRSADGARWGCAASGRWLRPRP